MTTSFNPDAPDFTPSFATALSAFAMEFQPYSIPFIPSFAPSEPEPVAEVGGSAVPVTEVAPSSSIPEVSVSIASVSPPHVAVTEEPKPKAPEAPPVPAKPAEEVLLKSSEQTMKKYTKDFILSLRAACRILPHDTLVPENYSPASGPIKKTKKSKRLTVRSDEKWATAPKYTLLKSENSFANYVKTLTSEQEKEVQQVRLLINKITEINYAKLSLRLFESYDYSGYLLEKLTWFIYERATMHHSFSEMFAKLCVDVRQRFHDTGKDEIAKGFRALILDKCEKAFYKQEIVEGNQLIDAETKRKVKLAGNVKFIAHLFRLRFISPRVIHECFHVLLNDESLSDESIETFCTLFISVAALIRTRTKDPVAEGEELREVYERATGLRNDERFSIRVRFMIQTLIEKRGELLTGVEEVKFQEPTVSSPIKPDLPASKYRKVEYDPAAETRRIKIPAEVLPELKSVLREQERLPAKDIAAKVQSLVGKHGLHRPEVVYQICKFALCDSPEALLPQFAKVLSKTHRKGKVSAPHMMEGLLLAVANIKDLRLDCPKADTWLQTIFTSVLEVGVITEEQRNVLIGKLTETLATEGHEEELKLTPDQKVRTTQNRAEGLIREHLQSGNTDEFLTQLIAFSAQKGLAFAYMLRYVLISRPHSEVALFFSLVKESVSRAKATVFDVETMLREVSDALEDVKEDCPKAPEILRGCIADLISCNVIPEKHYI